MRRMYQLFMESVVRLKRSVASVCFALILCAATGCSPTSTSPNWGTLQPMEATGYHMGGRTAEEEPPGELINPRIFEEFNGWLSDRGVITRAIDLASGNRSNRFSASPTLDWSEQGTPYPWVNYEKEYENGRISRFSYRYVGETPEGLYLVLTTESGGGSFTGQSVMLVGFQKLSALKWGGTELSEDKRLLLVCYGRMGLGVGFTGEAQLDGDTLILSRRIPRQPVNDPTDEPLLVDVGQLFQPK